MAETLAELGSDRAWLVHGADGTDEVSIAGETYVAELRDGARARVHGAPRGGRPAAASVRRDPRRHARPRTPRRCAALLAGAASAYRDAVLLNAAAALVVAERAATSREGVALARESIDSGAARGARPSGSPRSPATRGAGAMSILDDIRAYKLAEVAARKAARPLAEVEAAARAAAPGRAASPTRCARRRGPRLRPDRRDQEGEPVQGADPRGLRPGRAGARPTPTGGAACLSVLTDAPSFQGDDSYLGAARAAVELPVLRKDFLFDPWQVAESRALGADCILIILASVSDAQARELEAAAAAWGMDVLVEVHDAAELERAKRLRSPLVGINNRDLDTFETDLDTTTRLARSVPADRIDRVRESGLATRQDLAQLARYGVRCFLIGETLMREAERRGGDPRAPAQPLDARGRADGRRSPISTPPARRRWSTSRTSPRPCARAVARGSVAMAPATLALVDRGHRRQGRRARRGAARRDHGGQAHRRADPALPPAGARQVAVDLAPDAAGRPGDDRGDACARPARPASRWRR